MMFDVMEPTLMGQWVVVRSAVVSWFSLGSARRFTLRTRGLGLLL